MEFSPALYSLNELVGSIFDIQKTNAANKNISLNKEFDTSFKIFVDFEMMQVVMRNLISNAIKFTNFGGSITVKAKQTDRTYITITDTGVGIPQEVISKLFRIDMHHSTDGTNKEQGTGLGLILCKEIIERHSGKILVESSEGKGSSFTISIPLAPNP
ncbi:MAG: hypothetical protein A2279_02615 [Stygiobacter sp. RIFOXYA12_FULL_38_9]|nr:MAG: hypothetical protein A2279_02615 [Stygiobacter sp. RIFOXYA12_FULL_38_9]